MDSTLEQIKNSAQHSLHKHNRAFQALNARQRELCIQRLQAKLHNADQEIQNLLKSMAQGKSLLPLFDALSQAQCLQVGEAVESYQTDILPQAGPLPAEQSTEAGVARLEAKDFGALELLSFDAEDNEAAPEAEGFALIALEDETANQMKTEPAVQAETPEPAGDEEAQEKQALHHFFNAFTAHYMIHHVHD